jgi:hypothetical protein
MNHIGIDVHKKESQICILGAGGELSEQRVRTTPDQFADVLGVGHLREGGPKPVSCPIPGPAVSLVGVFPGWPDSSARRAGPARARAGRDGLGET